MKFRATSADRPTGQLLAKLLRPHFQALYRMAYRLAGNPHDAEDLLQDLFVKVCDRLDEFSDISHPRAWMQQILYRLYIDSARRVQRAPVMLSADLVTGDQAIRPEPLIESFDPGHGPEEEAVSDERRHGLIEAWEQLTQEHQVVLAMHDIEGYTLNELNIILEVPLGTLKSRLHRARAQLRKILQREPFDPLVR